MCWKVYELGQEGLTQGQFLDWGTQSGGDTGDPDTGHMALCQHHSAKRRVVVTDSFYHVWIEVISGIWYVDSPENR